MMVQQRDSSSPPHEEVHSSPAPLWAVNALTFFASVGTGVVWAGIGFIAKHEYGFGKEKTLLLYLVMGVLYVGVALKAGAALRAVEQWISARSILMLLLVSCGLVCIGPLVIAHEWMLWFVALYINMAAAWLWPIVESYLTAGRHGEQMRRGIGWWNISWTSAVAFSLLSIAPLLESHARGSFAIVGVLNLAAAAMLAWLPQRPGAHDGHASSASIGRDYPYLLRSARTLLPLSYMLNAAMMPLLPFLLVERMHLPAHLETPAAATWTIARIGVMAVMWRMDFWHGKWSTLLWAGASMAAGFVMVVMGGSFWLMMIGLAIYGIGMGMVYYAALYYGMTVGKAAVDAGGAHEALIGGGYAVGPLAGFAGLFAAQLAEDRGMKLWDGAGVVAIASVLTIACGLLALKPFFQARRSRNASSGDHV